MNRLSRPALSVSPLTLVVFAGLALVTRPMLADIVPIVNNGFEDTTGQSTYNEFTFGTPVGWSNYNPNGVIGMPGVFVGTLMPNGVDFFNGPAPEGSRIAILFNSQQEGTGEYGFEQTLGTVLMANTAYNLSVQVGNIASGTSEDGTFYNLDEFPGYRVELLAGGTVIASDNNSLVIPEGEFATSTVQFTSGTTHPLLGQALGIRIVNLNIIPDGFTQASSPDLEVDFDQVILQATAIPEPTAVSWMIMLVTGIALFSQRRSRQGVIAKQVDRTAGFPAGQP